VIGHGQAPVLRLNSRRTDAFPPDGDGKRVKRDGMEGVEVGFWGGSEPLYYNGVRSSFCGVCAFHINTCETASQPTSHQNTQAWQNR
jgi:hypothetical protein